MVIYHPPGIYQLLTPPLDDKKLNALVDTNIFVYVLDAKIDPARTLKALRAIDAVDVLYTSAMCYMEVMVGYDNHDQLGIKLALSMFHTCKILPTLAPIEDLAVAIRRRGRENARAAEKAGKQRPAAAKLPDAIIHATALYHGLPILTNNPSDFKDVDADILATFGVANVAVDLY